MIEDQTFLTYAFEDANQRDRVCARLHAEDFITHDARRAIPHSLHIRVRPGTRDQSEVEKIITELAPNAEKLPGGTPTTGIVDYRKGRP